MMLSIAFCSRVHPVSVANSPPPSQQQPTTLGMAPTFVAQFLPNSLSKGMALIRAMEKDKNNANDTDTDWKSGGRSN
jgi:hypothetical protein